MENDINSPPSVEPIAPNDLSTYVELRTGPRLCDLMVPAGRVVFTDERLAAAWLTFIEYDLAVVPVASPEGEPVGVLCRDELVSALLNDEPTTPAALVADLGGRRRQNVPRYAPCPRVQDIMRPAAAVMFIEQSAERAAQLVSGAFGEFVIGVDRDGTIVGLVSTTALHWHGLRGDAPVPGETGRPSSPSRAASQSR